MEITYEKFNELERKLNTIISMLRQLPTSHHTDLGEWLTEEQTRELLQRGSTSLWDLRKRKKIKFSKVGNRTYYCRKSILDFIEKSKV